MSLVTATTQPADVRALDAARLPELCADIRRELIRIVSTTGGHLGVNLGVVELTVALYRALELPQDVVFWDVGHQVYVQKMLTGRLELLSQERSPKYSFQPESPYDAVTSSHAGASLALALGTAIAARMTRAGGLSVAVIGDGALVEGSSQEALNHMGVESGRMLMILNDNEMALDHNFGGLHEYLKRRQPGTAHPETYFASLGIPYVGPVDGHDVAGLVEVIARLKREITRPTVLHVKTVKGKGLDRLAEASPIRLHWTYPLDTNTGQLTGLPDGMYYPYAAAIGVEQILREDRRAVLVSPGALQSTATFHLHQQFAGRSFDVGMAEQHAITLAGGMARAGLKPILALEATFMQRSFDQVLHDLCINALPVLMLYTSTGHTGRHHLTHHSLHDLAYLRTIPGIRVVFPSSHRTMADAVRREFAALQQPTVVLCPVGWSTEDPPEELDTDEALPPVAGADGLLLSVGGPIGATADAVRRRLREQGRSFDHVAVTQIAPLAPALVERLGRYRRVITFEEGIVDGGFGSAIAEVIADRGMSTGLVRVGFPRALIPHGSRDQTYRAYAMDAAAVMARLRTRWPELELSAQPVG
jgi:1-deoxy-D-xylulose-5-phosphate synthase